MHSVRWHFVAGVVLFTTACGDNPDVLSPLGDEHTLTAATPTTPQRQNLAAVAHGIAVALADADVRQEVYKAFSTSDVAEGKVFLRDYLQQSSTGDVLRRTRDLSDLGAILAQLPPLEMYMPVPTHRATWDGSGDVLVAGTLSERGDVLGFSTDGRAIPLRGDVPPQLPTIVLVPQRSVPLGRHGASAKRSST